uniref:HMG box domain-containing protein n=1 Tax=Lactuca sativa TaxID=4236 RepID=A0A9R1XNK5_LACSA|nr:hypothetical protein LSAT_V11C400212880 [Lactuca sativa]
MQDQTMKGSKSSGATRKADTKLAVKKTAAKGKAAKDPNKPKRPASTFFVFMEDFRKQFKEDHPDNKSVAAVISLSMVEQAAKPLARPVWVLDATPGKVRAGRDGDDHPAELIISLRALPNQVTSKMEVISGLVREGFLNDVAQRDLGSQLVASIFELVCNPFMLSASGVILNRTGKLRRVYDESLEIFKEAMFLCIDDATKGRDVFKEKPPPDELMAASDIGKSVTTSLPENVAISPHYIYQFFSRNGHEGWLLLNGMVLCITDSVLPPQVLIINLISKCAHKGTEILDDKAFLASKSLLLQCRAFLDTHCVS